MSLDKDKLKRILEGALFAANQPLNLEKLTALFYDEERPPTELFVEALQELQQEYADRAVTLKEVASGYRFQVQTDVGEWVSRLWEEKPARYSRALLETLALVAYRQPITRGEIEEIRGVSVSTHITKTLLEREWIRVVGHRDVPGRPAMYGTTRSFLDYFNLKNLDELPSLAEIRDLDKISAELDQMGQDLLPPDEPEEGDEEGIAEEAIADAAVVETPAEDLEPAVTALAEDKDEPGDDDKLQSAILQEESRA
jgi:segregation and condensation protein B